MASPPWNVQVERSASLPPMAWLLHARPPTARLTIGSGVRAWDGAGIFEGTWVGDEGPAGVLRSTTPFGSGVLAEGEWLYLVPPGHMLEGIYACQRVGELFASNSLAGLLVAAGLELDSAVAYPPIFNRSVLGERQTLVPTLAGPITACFHDNLRLSPDGRLSFVPKPAEPAFRSFEDVRSRLTRALASALANAPEREPISTISSGYDSAAVSVLAAELGCRRALTIVEGKPVRGSESLSDSGEGVALRLGMEVHSFARLAYREREGLPEAEFMATGFSGEEIYLAAADELLAGKTLISAFFGDGMWRLNRPPRPIMWRSDQSGSSLGEFRLRVGFAHVPLPTFCSQHYPLTRAIGHLPEMEPWRIGVSYDRPIPRRILEQAGVPRGTFALDKRAASASIHADGPAAMAPATVGALERFAAKRGEQVSFRYRPPPSRLLKGLLKVARRLRLERVARRLELRKLSRAQHEPVFGSLLLRWALSVVAERYTELAPGQHRPARAVAERYRAAAAALTATGHDGQR